MSRAIRIIFLTSFTDPEQVHLDSFIPMQYGVNTASQHGAERPVGGFEKWENRK